MGWLTGDGRAQLVSFSITGFLNLGREIIRAARSFVCFVSVRRKAGIGGLDSFPQALLHPRYSGGGRDGIIDKNLGEAGPRAQLLGSFDGHKVIGGHSKPGVSADQAI